MTVNRYANVTVPTCQTGGQAAHKDPSSPLHFYSPLPFMIFNSLFFFSFFKLPSFLFSCFISFSSHWTVPCSHLTVYLPLLLSLLFFNFTMIASTQRCWCGSRAKIAARNTKKRFIQVKTDTFWPLRWTVLLWKAGLRSLCITFLSLSLPLSASSCILPLTPALPPLPPLPLKCLLPYIDRAVWHGQGIVVHEEIPLMAYVCVEGCVWIRLCIKSKVYFIFFQIPICSLVWERRGQWEHSRVAVCAAMHVYKCVFCVNVCVLCECVCVLQVTAGDSSHQNQAEPILYQAKENNHRYGWKLKIQVFSFHQFSTKKVSFKGAELIFTHRFCLHL